MDPKLLLAQKKAEALELRKKALETPADMTEADADRADALVLEIDDLEKKVARTDGIAAKLGGLDLEGKKVDTSAGDNLLSSKKNDEHPNDKAKEEDFRSPGERFVDSDAFKAFKAQHPRGISQSDTSVKINLKVEGVAEKAILRRPTTGNARAVRTGTVDDLVYRPPLRLLDLITTGTTDLPWFQYRQIIAKSNNSAIVPESSSTSLTTTASGYKPVSDLTTTTAEAREFTYADGMEVTNQELTDDGIMRSIIDDTLQDNLAIRKEAILLSSTAGADAPAGILETPGVLQQAFATDKITSIRKAITKLWTTSGANITAILMNPADDEEYDLLKDSHGDWIVGPFNRGPNTVWGVPRVVSPIVTAGQAIIGDFSTVHLLTYSPLEVLAFNQHADFARRNMTYVRAEERALQLVRNAAKLCVVDLTL